MSPSTRWCPTPEQLMILEELYKRGLRTPNASQIQKITAHLAYYGKIQGKNVFYWFQNHKARDRQKLRKKLHQQHLLQQQLRHTYQFDPQTHFTSHFPHDLFPAPPHFQFQLSNFYSVPDLHAQAQAQLQGTGGVREEAPETAMKRQQQQQQQQMCRADLPKDCLMGSYGHDSIMIMEGAEVGPTFPCCRTRPLETLELFPLTPPTAAAAAATAEHQKTTS